jgi:hypothetical protein
MTPLMTRDEMFMEPPDVTTYLVKRFRRNVNSMGWDYKGSVDAGLVYQTRITSLQNGQFYRYVACLPRCISLLSCREVILCPVGVASVNRFSVVGVSKRGLGLESDMSEPVKVDSPLPKGWTEFWDAQSKRSYYKNNATLQVKGMMLRC